ncbi:MAG: ATP-binding cassette domain-containing protein, partial [Thermoanaerobaculia bacterium]
TVRNNIAYGSAEMPLRVVEEAARAAYADEFIGELAHGYDSMIGEGGLKLSGGQRQRLAIARALVKDPPILIMDEATSHLDSESEALVQKALYNLMSGRTALVIAHRLSTVQRADRILVMAQGRIVEDGTHTELLAAEGIYKRLFDLQFPDVEPGSEEADDECAA